ncbi:uncharacterized protein F4812DRAFT_456733 [Daldinia caldariorum]|uniref:uncharacterized protein n=1 Tax=Daldinia caldariorum TaxID=326644 RepID=UPI00200845E6|nr:uncharacterized protein F4812DRAFT_456733 [Daldinia caldariorum]KAI1470721.1 hypothetical protein F4812DRAFT_456733 [Daldinia caldariorum]
MQQPSHCCPSLDLSDPTKSPSSSRKRSQITPPDIEHPPRKRAKTSPEKDVRASQEKSSTLPIPPSTTQEANSTVLEWLDTLEQADATLQRHELLTKPEFRTITLPRNGIKILWGDDPTPNWVQEHIDTVDGYPDEGPPPNFRDRWLSFRRAFESHTYGSTFSGVYDKLLMSVRGGDWSSNTNQDADTETSYVGFRSMSASTIICPYLVMELKGRLGLPNEGDNQSIIGGRISLDITWSILKERDVVFLFNAGPYLCNINVMWRDVQETTTDTGESVKSRIYRVRDVKHLSPLVLEDALKIQNYFNAIQRWALEVRYPRIVAALKEWEEGGRQPHEFSSLGR